MMYAIARFNASQGIATMKPAFSTLCCPNWSLNEIKNNAKAFDFEGVELYAPDSTALHLPGFLHPDVTEDELKMIGAMFRVNGAPIFSLRSNWSLAADVGGGGGVTHRKVLERVLNQAEVIGAKYVHVRAGGLPRGRRHSSIVEPLADALRPIAVQASSRGVKVALETWGDWSFGEYLARLVRLVGEPNGLGILYNIHECFEHSIEAWPETYRKVKPYLCYCLIKYKTTEILGPTQEHSSEQNALPVWDVLSHFKEDKVLWSSDRSSSCTCGFGPYDQWFRLFFNYIGFPQ